MDQLFINLEKRNSVSGEDSYLHIISEEGDKIITAANLARGLFNVLTGGEPEAHNQIYRGGKILTDFYSYDEIIEMVQARDFSDIFVGDIIERYASDFRNEFCRQGEDAVCGSGNQFFEQPWRYTQTAEQTAPCYDAVGWPRKRLYERHQYYHGRI